MYFQNSPLSERYFYIQAYFYVTVTRNFERFQYFNFETNFQKNEYSFLDQSTETEKATFPYKTALSEANVKTNRMGSTKWVYHKERSFASNF